MNQPRQQIGLLLAMLLAQACADAAPQKPPPKRVETSRAVLNPVTPEARVAFEDASPSLAPRSIGRLDKETIRRGIARGINPMRLCWESALKVDRTTAPALTVRFVIDPTGHVASAEPLSTNSRDPEVDRCVLRAVKALVFPAPEGPGYVTVTYPFIVEITGS